MRRIILSVFVTLDGVMQAPGGPEEDLTNGFDRGGWTVNYWDELMNSAMGETMIKPFDLLLGRRTYEIFAAHWPYQTDDPVAEKFNGINKYVVGNKPIDLTWNNSIQVSGDIAAELKKLKSQDGNDLLVQGSSVLIQTLLANDLIDKLHIWTFPVTIGKGKRLFKEGTRTGSFKLVDSKISSTGVSITAYEPAGDLVTGSFVPENPSEAELARRKRFAEEERNK